MLEYILKLEIFLRTFGWRCNHSVIVIFFFKTVLLNVKIVDGRCTKFASYTTRSSGHPGKCLSPVNKILFLNIDLI